MSDEENKEIENENDIENEIDIDDYPDYVEDCDYEAEDDPDFTDYQPDVEDEWPLGPPKTFPGQTDYEDDMSVKSFSMLKSLGTENSYSDIWSLLSDKTQDTFKLILSSNKKI